MWYGREIVHTTLGDLEIWHSFDSEPVSHSKWNGFDILLTQELVDNKFDPILISKQCQMAEGFDILLI